MVAMSSRATGFDRSMPLTSAPSGASRLVVDIVITTPSLWCASTEWFRSIDVNAAQFDDLSPLFDLGCNVLAEIVRRPMLGRDQVGANVDQPFLHAWHLQRSHRGIVELLDNRLGRSLRQKEGRPAGDVEAGQPLLARARHAWH